jgi:hypothetical protein
VTADRRRAEFQVLQQPAPFKRVVQDQQHSSFWNGLAMKKGAASSP